MSRTEAGCGLMAFILCLSGIHGQTHICALRGSSVNLTCSTKNLTSSNKWFTEHRTSELVYKELSADERHVTHTSNENKTILTIHNLTKSDANVYCCGNTTEDPDPCRHRSIQLSVADLQVTVRVIKSEWRGCKVKLTCRTSCNLTESPAPYIWNSNEKPVKVKKPFYCTDISRNKTVTYHCAVNETYELRSPGVSLELSNSKTLNVTYAKGEMCSSQNKSEDEPCSFTHSIDLKEDLKNEHMNQSKTDMTATAVVAGASAALLVVIPAVVFIWIRTNRTLQQPSTTGGDIAPQLNSSHVYENIPVHPPQQDDVNYSTISFQPKEREHGAYAVVCFRPNV